MMTAKPPKPMNIATKMMIMLVSLLMEAVDPGLVYDRSKQD